MLNYDAVGLTHVVDIIQLGGKWSGMYVIRVPTLTLCYCFHRAAGYSINEIRDFLTLQARQRLVS